MTLLDISFFEITKYITHPISLVAYVCALILYFFISKNINDRKKIEANPEAYQATAERLHLDFKLIAKSERAAITLKVLKNRITSQLIIASALIIGGLLITYISVKYFQQTSKDKQAEINALDKNRRIEDSIQNSYRLDSINQAMYQDSIEQEKQKKIKHIDIMIQKGQSLMDSVLAGKLIEGKYACDLYSAEVVEEIQGIEKQLDQKTYQYEWSYYQFDNKNLTFEDIASQRVQDSLASLKEIKFCMKILNELKSSL